MLSSHADGLRLHATLHAALYAPPPHGGGDGDGRAAGARVSALATQSVTQPARLHVSFVHVHPFAETSLDLEMRGVVLPLTLLHPLPCRTPDKLRARAAQRGPPLRTPAPHSHCTLCTPSAPPLHPLCTLCRAT